MQGAAVSIINGGKDLLVAGLPKYGGWTGLAWPGTIPVLSWLVVNNNVDNLASQWHDKQPDAFSGSAPQWGWINRAWRGEHGRWSTNEIVGVDPYGQAVRVFGTVAFGAGGALLAGREAALGAMRE